MSDAVFDKERCVHLCSVETFNEVFGVSLLERYEGIDSPAQRKDMTSLVLILDGKWTKFVEEKRLQIPPTPTYHS